MVFFVELLIELGVPSLTDFGQFFHAGVASRSSEDAHHGRFCLRVTIDHGLINFLRQLDG